MKKFLKNKKGFTLIEMLIVVAIIGVLVLIFSPNFNLFNKADGAALNGKSKSIEVAVFQYYVDKDMEPLGAAPLATDFGAAGSAKKENLRQLLFNELNLSALSTETDLNNFLTLHTKLVDATTTVNQYIKGSTANVSEFVIVDINETETTWYNNATTPLSATEKAELLRIDGYILSKETIQDGEGSIYNGPFKYTP